MSGKVGDDMVEAAANVLLGEEWRWLGQESSYKTEREEVRRALEAALSASPQDGWVLVPREPTQAMIDAATESLTGIGAGADHDYDDDARSMYAAFIRALPQPTGDGT